MKRQKPKQGMDYIVDPITSRATFVKNNKAALVHGGYSKNIDQELLDVILSNDLGFEVGVLKGQLINIHTLGKEIAQKLLEAGDGANALSVALSCADRASKIVPQIQRALESQLSIDSKLDVKKQRQKNRWLKRFHAGSCSASEIAFQFEVNELGQPPIYVMKMLEVEIKATQSAVDDTPYSREEFQSHLAAYWQGTEDDAEKQNQRVQKIQEEKKRISEHFFGETSVSNVSKQVGHEKD